MESVLRQCGNLPQELKDMIAGFHGKAWRKDNAKKWAAYVMGLIDKHPDSENQHVPSEIVHHKIKSNDKGVNTSKILVVLPGFKLRYVRKEATPSCVFRDTINDQHIGIEYAFDNKFSVKFMEVEPGVYVTAVLTRAKEPFGKYTVGSRAHTTVLMPGTRKSLLKIAGQRDWFPQEEHIGFQHIVRLAVEAFAERASNVDFDMFRKKGDAAFPAMPRAASLFG